MLFTLLLPSLALFASAPAGPQIGAGSGYFSVRLAHQAHGFRLAKEHTFLPYQYFLVFEVR